MRCRPATWVLSVGLVACLGVLAWWTFGHARTDADASSAVQRAQPIAEEVPLRLVGREDVAPSAEGDRPAEDETAEPEAQVVEPPLRLLDGRGNPISGASVEIVFTDPSGWFSCRTDADGRCALAIEPGSKVLTVRVETPWWPEGRTVLDVPEGADLARLAELTVNDLLMLHVRTVDSRGRPRPDQRIYYGVWDGERAPVVWWGDSSDDEGSRRLGPFVHGTRVDVCPSAAGAAWSDKPVHQVVVDGRSIDVLVGDEPRLRLRFRGLLPGETIPVAALDARTGKSLLSDGLTVDAAEWTAPAIAPGLVLEIVAGPLSDGRFARVRDVRPREDPLDVELKVGPGLTGRVVLAASEGSFSGIVQAMGRGFEATAEVDERGGFRFPGLPDEELALLAQVRLTGSKDVFMGNATRQDERHVDISLARAVRVAGLVLASDGGPGGPGNHLRVRARSPDLPAPPDAEWSPGLSFKIHLQPGDWTLEAVVHSRDGGLFVGNADLRDLRADVDDLVILLGRVGR